MGASDVQGMDWPQELPDKGRAGGPGRRVSRRAVAAGALATAAAGVLAAACGATDGGPAKPGGPAGPVKLTHWQHGTPGVARSATVDELIGAYRRQHPQVEISFEPMAQAVLWDKLTTALATDTGPDVFQLPMGWTPLYIGRNQLAPTDPAFVKVGDEFLPWTVERLKRGSQYFGAPVDVQTMVLYCNDEVFRQSGVDIAKPPVDWAGVEQWARALTKRSGGELQQIGIDLGYYSAGSELVFQQKLQPVPMVDPKTNTVNWGRPEVLEAFTWYTTMVQQYGDPNFRPREFWSGKVGMTIGHPVSRSTYAQRAPDLKYTIHPFPSPAGKPPLTIGSHWAWVVNKQSKLAKEAWRWIAFGTSDEAQITWYRSAGDLPSRKKHFTDPALRKTPNDVVVMDSMKVARPWSWIGWAEWSRIYGETATRVVKGEQSPKQSLAQAADEINRVIQENLPPK